MGKAAECASAASPFEMFFSYVVYLNRRRDTRRQSRVILRVQYVNDLDDMPATGRVTTLLTYITVNLSPFFSKALHSLLCDCVTLKATKKQTETRQQFRSLYFLVIA